MGDQDDETDDNSNVLQSNVDLFTSSIWQTTLTKVVKAVVAIKFCTTRHFDTERAGYSVATGFVVDKKKGLLLSNRHVVRPGPVLAEAILLDHEEIPIHPVYRDPVHDFGFYRFNPADVKYMNIEEIELAPQDAKIGVDIRVVGNDAGEKLSILSGTLARLDRPAPHYGEDEYNDFNTFYIQAASSTSGGSSGSPVVNLQGKAVGLVAGGKKRAASSFYLPLDRVVRALELLRQDNFLVPRGTLQTVFKHTPYNEVKRLGLQQTTEKIIRETFPSETGMLVVDQVLPNRTDKKLLEPGDILVKVNEGYLTSFLALEEILDENVGKSVIFQIERGGFPLQLTIEVQNLHSITPDSFLEIGGAILHPLSYQQARNHRLPCGSIYVASEGYMFGRAGILRGSIILGVAKSETPNLETLIQAFSTIADRERFPIRFFSVFDRQQERISVVTMDRCWHPIIYWSRNDEKGIWDSKFLPAPEVNKPPKLGTAIPLAVNSEIGTKVAPSIVLVRFNVPYVVDGGSNDSFLGCGVIVDIEKGLILVDQNTVPLPLGDLFITFGGSFDVPANVLYIHPIHNFAIIQYDPKLLTNTAFASAKFSPKKLKQGDNVYLVGLANNGQLFCQSNTVSRIEELFIAEGRPPRYRATNEECIQLERYSPSVGGLLVDSGGEVQGIWASYSTTEKKGSIVEIFRGFDVDLISDVLEPLKNNKLPEIRSLEAELWPTQLSSARDLGLSEHWIQQVEKHDPFKRHVLTVRRLAAKTDASLKLKTGDLILAVNGNVVTTFRDVEKATINEQKVELTILRMQSEMKITVETTLLNGEGTNKVVCWGGALLQNTHRAVGQLGYIYDGVYCSRWHYGSPSHRFSLRAVHWVVEVDGKQTPNLDTFLEVVKGYKHGSSVRIKLIGLQDKVLVITMKLDYLYWPTWVLERKPGGQWVYTQLTQYE